MRITDLDLERHRRAHRRLAATVRQVRLHAEPCEVLGLERLLDGVADGSVSPVDAQAALAGLQCTQQNRRAA